MSFEAQEEKVFELFNRKVYNIPRNQRRYVWNKDNWKELYDDVMAVVNGNLSSHFIGSVVLRKDPVENGLPRYSVIDGQQRTITLSIFLGSIMFWMKKLSMEDDYNGTKPYIIAKNDKNKDVLMVTAESSGSLESIMDAIVNLSDDDVKVMTANSIVEKNLLNKSDKNIGDAFKFFLYAVSETLEEYSKDKQILIEIRNAVRDISLINITATNDEDSYTIFEILNARGLDLEDHELLKNYIMRYIQPEENRDKAKTEWNRMETIVGHSNLKKFIRHYTTHRYGDYRSNKETSDYKIIQSSNKGIRTWDLLKDLERKSGYYQKLVSPNKEGEKGNCSDLEYRVYNFFKKKRQAQMRPVLLSLIAKKDEGSLSNRLYENTIVFLYNYFICYNIIGEENSNRLTNIINKYSARINKNPSEEEIKRFVNELKMKLPSKSMFINAFSNVGWSHHDNIYEGEKNKTRVQTVLEVLERYVNYGSCLEGFTIEHVFPDCEDVRNGQVGNLIPLEERLNKECNGKTFAEKLEIYKKSQYQTTRRFSEMYLHKEFDPSNRTNYLAELFYNKILNL